MRDEARWQKERLSALLTEVDELCSRVPPEDGAEAVRVRAELLMERGVRLTPSGTWIHDGTRRTGCTAIFVCSLCNHWQTIRNPRFSRQIRYMNYCPFCGARMEELRERDTDEV